MLYMIFFYDFILPYRIGNLILCFFLYSFIYFTSAGVRSMPISLMPFFLYDSSNFATTGDACPHAGHHVVIK